MNGSERKKILLVEDSMITALSEEAMLINNGYDVITVPDGESAVEIALKDLTIDLILMDIDLGRGIDGPTAADLILKHRDIPIVFLTSHSESEIVDKVRSITRYGFVVKNSGDFVLLSSLEMAFELFGAHTNTKDSETNFRQLAENINEAFWLSDALMSKILYISPACWDMWGLDSSVKHNDHWIFMKSIHPEDLPGMIAAQKLLLEKGELFNGEFRILCGEGVIKWIRGRAYPVYSHSGELVRFAGVAEDITLRKSAEEALLRSEAKFRSYIANAPIAVFIMDNKGRYVEVNTLALKSMGYSEEELFKLNVRDVVDPLNSEVAANHFAEVLKEGRTQGDILFRKKDGSILWAQVNAVKLSEDRVMAFCQDITTRKKAEVILYKSEERMRNIFDNLPIGIFQSTVEGKFVYINPIIPEILGYDSIQEFVEIVNGSSIVEALYVDPQIRDKVLDEIISKPGSWTVYDNRFRRKDGAIVDVVMGSCERPDPVNGEISLYGYAIDVTGKKNAEKEIKRLLFEKELLLKEVHHRIKNNMSAVSALLYLQSASVTDPAALSALEDGCNRITSMMLIYDKLYMTGDYKNIDLTGYISDLVDEIASTFNVKGRSINIIKDIADFSMDSQQIFPLGIIINEIITNAFKYAFPGRSDGVIFISLKHSGNKLKLIVRDNGIGISDSFDIKNTEGFGLSLVNILVEQMNGLLEITNKGGTEYSIIMEV